MRELIGIIDAAGNGRRLRGYGLHEGIGRRRLAAVVADFQDIGLDVLFEELLLDFLLGVAGEQHGELAVGHLADNGIVIGQTAFRDTGRILLGENRTRRKDRKDDVIAKGQAVPFLQYLVGDLLGLDVL